MGTQEAPRGTGPDPSASTPSGPDATTRTAGPAGPATTAGRPIESDQTEQPAPGAYARGRGHRHRTGAAAAAGAAVGIGARGGADHDPEMLRQIRRTLEERAEEIAYRNVTPVDKRLLVGSEAAQLLGSDIELAHEHVLGGLYRTFKGLQRFSEGLEFRRRKMEQGDEDAERDMNLITAAMSGLTSRFSSADRYAGRHGDESMDEVADDTSQHGSVDAFDADRDGEIDTDAEETYFPFGAGEESPDTGSAEVETGESATGESATGETATGETAPQDQPQDGAAEAPPAETPVPTYDGYGDYDGDGYYDGDWAGDRDGDDGSAQLGQDQGRSISEEGRQA